MNNIKNIETKNIVNTFFSTKPNEQIIIMYQDDYIIPENIEYKFIKNLQSVLSTTNQIEKIII